MAPSSVATASSANSKNDLLHEADGMGCGQSRLPVSPPEYTVDGKAIDATGTEPSAASGLDSLHRTASSQQEQSALGGGSASADHQSSHKLASDTPVAGSVAASSPRKPGLPCTAPGTEATAP